MGPGLQVPQQEPGHRTRHQNGDGGGEALEDVVGVLDGGGHHQAAHSLQQDDEDDEGAVALHQPCQPREAVRWSLLRNLMSFFRLPNKQSC